MLLASAGHAVPAPVQCSARSHSPWAGRHTTDAGPDASGGQLPRAPLAGRGPADPPAVAGWVLPVIAPPVAPVPVAGVGVTGAGGARRLLRIRGAGGTRPGAVLGRVALARRGAADGGRRLEVIGR